MAGNRFYLPAYRHKPDREPYLQDIGSVLTISGIVFQGMGSTLVLLSPGADEPVEPTYARPDLEEWGEILRVSDDPQIFIGEVGGLNRALHRKQRFSISGEIQQRIWARDSFKCVYCGARMGTVLMTIDHWLPLEQGGVNDESNYLTACRNCNKAKGMMMPEEFCEMKGFNYEAIKSYLEVCNGNR